ncbi:MaoC/PaaZ C-terminal domain-containing protein [Pelagibacteraceae bacterium]|nr:MaoC/PaaZ C-terminal domain-containing protein [Pelagibacteraceae bacterium]
MIEVEQFYEDYEVEAQRTTSGRTITETDIVTHAMHSGDFYPHHVDAEFAKKGPFGQRVAQFSCTFSIGIALTASIMNKRAFTYGFERLRFPNPVFIGDTIHTKVTIKEKKDDPKRPKFGQVNEACEIINQNNKVVCYSEHILLVEKKNP